jgi:hypothetical protein
MHRRLLLLPLTLLAFSGCGSSEEDAVRDVVKNYTKAFSERDAKTVCKLLVPKAQMIFQVVGQDCETARPRASRRRRTARYVPLAQSGSPPFGLPEVAP